MDQAPSSLAVAAASYALDRAKRDRADGGMVLYATAYETGFDLWNSAAYLQRESGVPGGTCVVAEVRSGCAGGLVALGLARSHLLNAPPGSTALVAAADCWRLPAFDRWRADIQTVFGDAGAAVVVSQDRDGLELIAFTTHTDPDLEGFIRGDDPLMVAPGIARPPIDITRRAREFSRAMPKPEIQRRLTAGPRVVLERLMSRAGIHLDDVAHVVLPFLGHHTLAPVYFDGLGVDVARTTFDYGRQIGHTGAPDPLLGLAYLMHSGRLASGEWVVAFATGAGFVWAGALLRAC
jgi:3-oxoacyl-[acyl-carrier-protein] synthase-3